MVSFNGQGRSESYPATEIGREDGQSIVEIEKLCPKCHRPLGISTDADEPYLSCRYQDCDNIDTYPCSDDLLLGLAHSLANKFGKPIAIEPGGIHVEPDST